MPHWVVTDRHGREIYLTEERWERIRTMHPALGRHRNHVLETIRHGPRRRVADQPEKYRYTRRFSDLPGTFNAVVVVVLFRFRQRPDGETVPNNYVVTAWPAHVW